MTFWKKIDSRKIIVFDLDGTLCTGKPYENAIPIRENIDRLNREFPKEEYRIIIWTARGGLTFDGDLEQIENKYREMTEAWLKKHNVNHEELWFGKPVYDLFIDDKTKNWSVT